MFMKDENVAKDGIKLDPKVTESQPLVPPQAVKSTPKKPPTRYMVAKGKTIQCAGGRKRSGYTVSPREVGGQKHFDQLLASGVIVKK
jgi:hypothetical protein